MPAFLRAWFPLWGPGLALAGVALVVSRGTLEQADFTFANMTDAESIDPAKATGQPEHRIIAALFEALVNYDPHTLAPIPGVAQSWEISSDQLQYTFHLRDDACWSDGQLLTSADFHWSLRRLLDPNTTANFAYQGWYIKNARRYTTLGIAAGDPVEVELTELPAGSLPFARGIVLHGKLVDVDKTAGPAIYRVEIEGRKRRFQVGTPSM